MKISVIGGGPAGLYFAILIKKSHPDFDVQIFERNPSGVTWGWGVVFSDETLERFQEADRQTYEEIGRTFARWESIDVHFKDRMIRSKGHVFCGIPRQRLLDILQKRCADLGVTLHFETDVGDLSSLQRDSDLLVAADGINSRVRFVYSEYFQPDILTGKNRYIWLATSKVFDSFKFIVRENQHGLFVVHAYPFDEQHSTFIVETDERSWRNAGLENSSEEQSLRYCEDLFAPELEGHALLSNRSTWISFRRIKNATWCYGNIVLIGDAAHTAHFSIGSGTKLAMEDAISLARALEKNSEISTALADYEENRWVDVAKLQRAAEVSQTFFEEIRRWKDFDPTQFTVKLLSRSKRVTHGNLKLRDPEYIRDIDRWFADRNGCASIDPPPPPMFTPFSLRGMELHNRVVVSPMCQYSAEDGAPNDWHFVHLASRAIGGPSLVFTEMTDVSREGRISPGCTGMYKDEHLEMWKRIVDFVHSNTRAKIGLQLAHAGRKGSTKLSWDGMDEPLPFGNWPLISASGIPWAPENQVPREMNRSDMVQVLKDFVRAAEMAIQAGFDILELHMAHGYLLSSFISPLTNQRRDEYGGSLSNRMRYPLEVFDAVRDRWPGDKPISIRISATDWVAGGFDSGQSVEAACMLKEHGCDIIDVSSGQTTTMAQPVYGSMFQAPFSDRIRNEAHIPTISVGNIQNWDQINTLIVSGQADLCALARPHLFEPYFTLQAAAEQDYDIDWPKQYLPAKPRPKKK